MIRRIKRRGDGEGCLVIVLLLLLFIVIISTDGTSVEKCIEKGRNQERQAAVEAGVAEWYATPEGKIEFRYKRK